MGYFFSDRRLLNRIKGSGILSTFVKGWFLTDFFFSGQQKGLESTEYIIVGGRNKDIR